jgi:hypothetical protein|tara:strand:+ start:146 stop:277 length:132 start_codon:yes stop_codon:yes gene_type:complete
MVIVLELSPAMMVEADAKKIFCVNVDASHLPLGCRFWLKNLLH